MNNPYKKQLRTENLIYKTILGDASTKTVKGEKIGFYTAIVYLVPSEKICPFAKKAGCLIPCLNSSGRGAFTSVQKSRQAKTDYFTNNNRAFMLSLFADIWTAQNRAKKLGLTLLVRLNGTSDILWENIYIDGKNVFLTFPNIQFYDYTKVPTRNLQGKTANNYDLTYSFSGLTPSKITEKGLNNSNNKRVAVVFHKQKDIPLIFKGFPVIDGDNTDVRHIEPKNVIVALYAKGKAKKDFSGFTQIKGVHYD